MKSKTLELLREKKAKSKESFRDLEKVCGMTNGHLAQLFKGNLKKLPFENEKFIKLLDHYNLPHHEPEETAEDHSEGHRLRQLKEMVVTEIKKKSKMLNDEDIQNCIPALVQVFVEGGFSDESYKHSNEKAFWDHLSLGGYFIKNDTMLNPYGNLGNTVRNFYWDYLSSFDSAILLIRDLIHNNLKSINLYGPVYKIDYLNRNFTLFSYNQNDKDSEIVMMAYKTNTDFKKLVDAALKLV